MFFWYFLKSLNDDLIEKIHSVIILNVKFILSNWKNSKPKRSYWKCFLFWITLWIHRRWSAIVQKFHDKKSECVLVIIIMIWVKTLLSLNLHQPSLTLSVCRFDTFLFISDELIQYAHNVEQKRICIYADERVYCEWKAGWNVAFN